MTHIHPMAVVSERAKIGRDVEIGPLAIVEADVTIGDGCRLGSHSVVKSGTTMGAENHVGEGAVLGGLPQHVRIPENPGRLVIGSGNMFRENCTLHRSLYGDKATIVGDNNLMMVASHVAHDCIVGNQVILTNNVMLGGHVEVQDRAYVGGGAAVHQFCRIGQLAMIGGCARVKKDVMPYVLVDDGTSMIVGLNKVGLKRSGLTEEQVSELMSAYRLIFRSGLKWSDVAPALVDRFPDGPAAEFHKFLQGGKRGFVQERRMPAAATVRLHRIDDEGEEFRSMVG